MSDGHGTIIGLRGALDIPDHQRPSGIVTKSSPLTVSETVARLSGLLTQKGLRMFSVIDQRAEAADVGLELRETTLVLFGSPVFGTPVMAAAPLSALDLPLKVLVWDNGGRTSVSYVSPDKLASRYGLPEELAARLAGIDTLTEALIAV